ncbi:MAG: hypothetical protein Q9191_007878 [Dirinaria sp. TL-2023a]
MDTHRIKYNSNDALSNSSNAATDSTHHHGYINEWLESSFSCLKNVDEQHIQEEDEGGLAGGLATQLYSSCQSVLDDLCKEKQRRNPQGSQQIVLTEELAKLYLWGQSFAPGELDAALQHSDDVRYIVLDALACIGRSLLQVHSDEQSQAPSYPVEQTKTAVSCQKEQDGDSSNEEYIAKSGYRSQQGSSKENIRLDPKSVDTNRQALALRDLFEKMQTIISCQNDNDGDSDSDDGLSDNDDETGDIVEELRSHVSHLVELGPTLQQNVVCARKARFEMIKEPQAS